ncbi:MAG TPA: hypothetical protein IGS53_23015 [Leptolyngbyaceae cyanobacterium M33_DOE_097]|uniref:Uncharacterized protein n=1 Tax=Oscillatoriales cyanobacterium SpSt-418 TaxID=2282169 RepID=A0A7C3KBS9_9CYAN|nr:hypothetical protein [Leptolyngbyaceae cyanobacterium M33_DOE_097]
MTQGQHPVERMDYHLDGITEAELLVLKTHLLIEKALFTAVQRRLPNPYFLQKAKPGFAQLLSLAKAFFYKEGQEEIWEAIQALNAIRNRLAHELEPGDMKSELRKMSCVTHLPDDFSLEHPSALSVLNHVAGFLIGFASSLST